MHALTDYCPESNVPKSECVGCKDQRIKDLEQRIQHIRATLDTHSLTDHVARRTALFYIDSFEAEQRS